MTFRLQPLYLVFSMLVVSSVDAATTSTAIATLVQVRKAAGGDAWKSMTAFTVDGSLRSDGIDSVYKAAVDGSGNRYVATVQNPARSFADGRDEAGRWHVDVSGLVHPLDSREALPVGVSEAWLARFGWLDARDDATYVRLPDIVAAGKRYEQLKATPPGGREVTLWIDPATHRVDRAMWNASFLIFTRRYADYRTVKGAELPFRIATTPMTSSGTVDGDEVVQVESYAIPSPADLAKQLRRPDGVVRDVTMLHNASMAQTPMSLEGGAILVNASINGSRPMPFILDTGGHAILTDDAARKLGIKGAGQGVSTGSGPGSMTTSYARIDRLTMGDAVIHDQTFLVMPYPYPFYERGEGEPIAGILGLELFERFAVTFDYDHARLLLQPYDRGTAPPAGGGDALPLSFSFDMPLVDGAIDDRKGVFGIDTGNSGNLLVFPQWAGREGLAARYAAGYPASGGGVGGSFVSHVAHTRSMQLGKTRVDDVVAQLTPENAGATANPSEAGNIGQDVLARFIVHIDYRRGTMYLAPRAKAQVVHNGTAGLRVERREDAPDRFIVTWVVPGGPADQIGLKKDDAIVAVDGKSARAMGGWTLRDIINHRDAGTKVELTMADGAKRTLTLRDIAPL
ncbi:aspartyl protease [Luteibacter rhizovicinus]|uniref:Aspartyl protease n=1 Tax=Luteibacter rhizovicinus TaxID=242606 RepID=A0A4R3YIS5_9GAMM|nr:aspartyl protease family protein [Luteibacter rhizovicinus]TCV92090.1 aspartyl protease [Luteibacter rhizovicinus]